MINLQYNCEEVYNILLFKCQVISSVDIVNSYSKGCINYLLMVHWKSFLLTKGEHMVIKELIELLQNLPNQDQLILVDGYETGYDHITTIDETTVSLYPDGNWYDGDYEYNKLGEKAYVIPR